jgi:hypothetical protein
MITAEQIKAARALLNWSRWYLAEQAFGVSAHTVAKAEGERAGIAPTDEQLAAIKAVLGTNGDEAGVRLRAQGKRTK